MKIGTKVKAPGGAIGMVVGRHKRRGVLHCLVQYPGGGRYEYRADSLTRA